MRGAMHVCVREMGGVACGGGGVIVGEANERGARGLGGKVTEHVTMLEISIL